MKLVDCQTEQLNLWSSAPSTVEGCSTLLSKVKFKTNSAESKLGEYFLELAGLVNLSHLSNGVEVRYRSAKQNKQGHFSTMAHNPRPRRPTIYVGETDQEVHAKVDRYKKAVKRYKNALPDVLSQPEILVIGNPASTALSLRMSVYHEVGHALDWNEGQDKLWEGYYSTGRKPDEHSRRFIRQARRMPSLEAALAGYTRSQRRYFASSIEIWARAFSQWAGYQACTPLPAERYEHQFTVDEIVVLAPLIEACLENKGLLQK